MKRPMVNALTLCYFLAGPVTRGQNAGEIERSTPDPYRVTPQGYVSGPGGKGCVLLLTASEYTQGLRRGKTWRRDCVNTARDGIRLACWRGENVSP